MSTLRASAKEIEMPKGQQRGNKEAKKPKQPKKTSGPRFLFLHAVSTSGAGTRQEEVAPHGDGFLAFGLPLFVSLQWHREC